MRHGTGREAGRGMDANTMAASRNIPGLCPEIATAERESAEFYYLCNSAECVAKNKKTDGGVLLHLKDCVHEIYCGQKS